MNLFGATAMAKAIISGPAISMMVCGSSPRWADFDGCIVSRCVVCVYLDGECVQHGSGCLDFKFLGSLEMEYAIPRDSMRHAWSLPGFRYLFRSAEQVLERLGHRRVAAGLANRGIPDTGRSNLQCSAPMCTLCTPCILRTFPTSLQSHQSFHTSSFEPNSDDGNS